VTNRSQSGLVIAINKVEDDHAFNGPLGSHPLLLISGTAGLNQSGIYLESIVDGIMIEIVSDVIGGLVGQPTPLTPPCCFYRNRDLKTYRKLHDENDFDVVVEWLWTDLLATFDRQDVGLSVLLAPFFQIEKGRGEGSGSVGRDVERDCPSA
jgi:hypothetical protein